MDMTCVKKFKKIGKNLHWDFRKCQLKLIEQKINNVESLDINNKNYSTSGKTSGKKPENNWIMLFGLDALAYRHVKPLLMYINKTTTINMANHYLLQNVGICILWGRLSPFLCLLCHGSLQPDPCIIKSIGSEVHEK